MQSILQDEMEKSGKVQKRRYPKWYDKGRACSIRERFDF
jgi:hypothetical protein